MKPLIRLISLLIAVILPLQLMALVFTAKNPAGVNIYYRTLPQEGTVEVMNGDINYQGVVDVPAIVTYKGVQYDVIRIADAAFSHCSKLTSVSLPESVREIGIGVFMNCGNLHTVKLSANIDAIPESAFFGCLALSEIDLPKKVRSIGNMAFSECPLLRMPKLHDSLVEIGYFAFAHCTTITSVDLPNSVVVLGQFAFAGCSRLSSVRLPDSLTVIDQGLFEDCTSLRSITLPKTVIYIEDFAFKGCSSLAEININGYNPMLVGFGANAFDGIPSSCRFTVPSSARSAYISDSKWSRFMR